MNRAAAVATNRVVPTFWLLRRFAAFVILALFTNTEAWAAGPDVPVTVKKLPAQIARKTFDPEKPPAEMPPLAPFEAGLCEFSFGCETRLQVSMLSSRATIVPGTISSIKVITTLQIVVWTAENSPKKIIAHEEAHRAIAEHYYVGAEGIAQRLGQRQIGRKITVPMRNEKPDLDSALGGLQNEIVKDFLSQTAQRCKFAQERFDAITDHSRNPVPEDDAMAAAIKDEEAHYARSRGATE